MTADPHTLSLTDLAAAVVRLGAHRDWYCREDLDLLLAAANRLPAVVAERDEAVAAAKLAEDERRWVRVDLVNAIQRAALAEGKLRETTYAALAAREQGEADTVARIVAWLDDPEGEPISHEMLRGYGLQDYSQRVEKPTTTPAMRLL